MSNTKYEKMLEKNFNKTKIESNNVLEQIREKMRE